MATMIVPAISVDDVELLRDFYLEKLGFQSMMGVVGKDGKLETAMVTRAELSVMIGRPERPTAGTSPETARRPVQLYCYLDDVDGYYGELKKRRVAIDKPIETAWWGDRLFSVKDPYGYTIWFCQTVGEFKPPPGVKVI